MMKVYAVTTEHPRSKKRKKWLLPAYNMDEVNSFFSAGVPLNIITIGQLPKKNGESIIKRYKEKFPIKQQLEFFEGLTPLMQVGFNPIKAFLLQARASNKMGVRVITMDIVHGILQGELLNVAFQRHRAVFDETILALIEEGENTGTIAETFEEIVRVLSKDLENSRKLASAMTYPIIVIIMAFIVAYIFTAVLIPKIKTIYDTLNGELPGITKFVVGVSTFLQANPLVMIIPIVFFVVWGMNSRKLIWKMWYCKFILFLPVAGDFMRKTAITNGCRSLSVLLNSGIPMAHGLAIAGRSTGSAYFLKVFEDIRDMINNGESMTIAFQLNSEHFGILGERLAAAIESGETSGEIDRVLKRLSTTFEREMDVTIDRVEQTVVPMVTVGLAVFVGVIVFAIFLPLFGMGKVLMNGSK